MEGGTGHEESGDFTNNSGGFHCLSALGTPLEDTIWDCPSISEDERIYHDFQ